MEEIEHGAIIKFLNNGRKSAQTILEELSSVYLNSYPEKNMVYKCHSLVRQGRESLEGNLRRVRLRPVKLFAEEKFYWKMAG